MYSVLVMYDGAVVAVVFFTYMHTLAGTFNMPTSYQ